MSREGSDDLAILVIALVMLASLIGFLAFTSSDGPEPIPLPTAPLVAP
jgi:hypothetical protein